LHTIVGAGSAEGTMDASNIIKPALSRGEMQCIGATTLNEYRKYIEKDAAWNAASRQVKVEAPSVEEADPDPQGPPPQIRGASQGRDHRRGHRSRRQSFPTVISPTVSCPTRPST
jgi:hypothetical protein